MLKNLFKTAIQTANLVVVSVDKAADALVYTAESIDKGGKYLSREWKKAKKEVEEKEYIAVTQSWDKPLPLYKVKKYRNYCKEKADGLFKEINMMKAAGSFGYEVPSEIIDGVTEKFEKWEFLYRQYDRRVDELK